MGTCIRQYFARLCEYYEPEKRTGFVMLFKMEIRVSLILKNAK